MNKNWIGTAIVLIIIILAVVAWLGAHDDRRPKVPPAVQRDVDSIKDTRPAYDSMMAVMRARVVKDSVARVQVQQRAHQDSLNAVRTEQRADSIAATAQSAEQWHSAYDAEHVVALHWKTIAFEKDTALQYELAGHLTTKLQLDSAQKRVRHLESVTIPGLKHTIASLEKPCYLIGSIPCPSRKLVAATFAIAGAVARR